MSGQTVPEIEFRTYDHLPEEAVEIRREVFMDEQGYADEFDDVDGRARHIVAFLDGRATATCRLFAGSRRGVPPRLDEQGPRREWGRAMTLFIDADACPVTADALAVARRAGVAVVIAGNTTQNLERHVRPGDPRDAAHARRGFWVDTLAVSTGADSADFAIVESLQPGDVVVTQDIGLAAMVLGRGARAIGVRGRVYSTATIDSNLFIRAEEKKVRRAGGRTKGPSAFTDRDRRRFVENLEGLLGIW